MWGWGQLAAGDRRGWLLPPLQVAALAVLGLVVPALASGTAAAWAFLAGVAVFVAWAAVAAHAWRRAARRRARLDLDPGGGALGLLWLAPPAILGASLFWSLGSGDPGRLLEDYVADWTAGRSGQAGERFAGGPVPPGTVEATWERQAAALRNELLRLAPQAPDGATFDPDRPIETVRWVEAGPAAAGGRLLAIEVARHEIVRGDLFGLPIVSQQLVPLARLGMAELRPVPDDGPFGRLGWDARWRIVRVEVLGISLTSP